MSSPATTSRLSDEKSASASKALRGAQIGEEIHLLAQAQQPALGLHGKIQIVVFRPAHGAQKHRVDLLRARHRRIGQRRAMRVIGRPADQILGHLEGDPAPVAEPVDEAATSAMTSGPIPSPGRMRSERVVMGAILGCGFASAYSAGPAGSRKRPASVEREIDPDEAVMAGGRGQIAPGRALGGQWIPAPATSRSTEGRM